MLPFRITEKTLSENLPQFIKIEKSRGDDQNNKTVKTTYRNSKRFDMNSFKKIYKAQAGLLPLTQLM